MPTSHAEYAKPTRSEIVESAPVASEVIDMPIVEAVAVLRPAEQRLLIAISDPRNLGKPVKQIIRIADVAEDTYYKLMQRPDFDLRRREALREALGDLTKALAALKASAEDGSSENKNGPADRRLLFQLAGFADRKQIEVTGSVETHLNVSDSQMLSMYLALGIAIDRWVPAIRQAYEDGRLVAKAMGDANDDA